MTQHRLTLALFGALSLGGACSGEDSEADTMDDAGSSAPDTDSGGTTGGDHGSSADTNGSAEGDGSTGDPSSTTSTDDSGDTTTAVGPSGTSGGTSQGGSTGGGESTGGDASTDGGSTGGVVPDDCAGLDQEACYAEKQLGHCEPIWGTPYIQPPNMGGEWCLFINGVEYLGCAPDEGCRETKMTVCQDQPYAAWEVTSTCMPSDLDVEECDPPGDCIY